MKTNDGLPGPRFMLHGHLVGGHYHCRLFAGAGSGRRGMVGALIMDEADWEAWGALAEHVGRVEEPPDWPEHKNTWACDPCIKGRCDRCTSRGPEGYCYCDGLAHPEVDVAGSLADAGVL